MNRKTFLRMRIFFLILIITSFLMFSFIIKILKPSINSYLYVCKPEIAEIREIESSASTKTTYDNQTKKIINITIEYKEAIPSIQILKHEHCHVSQNQRKYFKLSASCSHPIEKLIKEMECYIAESLGDKLYEKIYGKFD